MAAANDNLVPVPHPANCAVVDVAKASRNGCCGALGGRLRCCFLGRPCDRRAGMDRREESQNHRIEGERPRSLGQALLTQPGFCPLSSLPSPSSSWWLSWTVTSSSPTSWPLQLGSASQLPSSCPGECEVLGLSALCPESWARGFQGLPELLEILGRPFCNVFSPGWGSWREILSAGRGEALLSQSWCSPSALCIGPCSRTS